MVRDSKTEDEADVFDGFLVDKGQDPSKRLV